MCSVFCELIICYWIDLHCRRMLVELTRVDFCATLFVCACPGRLEVSRGSVEANGVTLERHRSSSVDLTNTNSCQLNSTPLTPTNCSRITLPRMRACHSIRLSWLIHYHHISSSKRRKFNNHDRTFDGGLDEETVHRNCTYRRM